MILDLYEVVVAGYATTSRETCWLEDPYVVVLGQVVLMRESFPVLLEHFLHLFKEFIGLLLFWLVLDHLVFGLVSRGFFFLLFLLLLLGFLGDAD